MKKDKEPEPKVIAQGADNVSAFEQAFTTARPGCIDCRIEVAARLSEDKPIWFEHELCAGEFKEFKDEFLKSYPAWVQVAEGAVYG